MTLTIYDINPWWNLLLCAIPASLLLVASAIQFVRKRTFGRTLRLLGMLSVLLPSVIGVLLIRLAGKDGVYIGYYNACVTVSLWSQFLGWTVFAGAFLYDCVWGEGRRTSGEVK